MKNLIIMGLILWNLLIPTANIYASPISFTFSEYNALAVLNSEFRRIEDRNISSTPPVSAFAQLGSNPNFKGSIDAPDFSNIKLHVNSIEPIELGDRYFESNAYTEVYYKFTATVPEIRVSYDYNFISEAGILKTCNVPTEGRVNSSLRGWLFGDNVGYVPFWPEDDLRCNVSYSETIGKKIATLTGSIDEVFPLIIGNNYTLLLASAYINASAYGGGYGICDLTISNIQIEAVPLPSAIILLGAGLGRLVLYSRRKRTDTN